MGPKWLVCFDFSEQGEKIVESAALELDKLSGHLVLLHVFHFPPSQAALAVGSKEGLTSVQEFSDSLGLNVRKKLAEMKTSLEAKFKNIKLEILVREGNPVDEIIEGAKEQFADRVVVGSHSRKGLERFLMGSVAERVVRLCPVSVLVLKP